MKKTVTHKARIPRHLTLTHTHTYNDANLRTPQESTRGGHQHLQLNSQLVCYSIASLQSDNKKEPKENPSPKNEPSPPHTPQAIKEENKVGLTEKKSSSRRVKSRLAKGSFVTLLNFQRHLEQLWLQDKSLGVDDLMMMGHKLIGMMEEDSCKLINLNKYWCSRLLEKLKGLKYSSSFSSDYTSSSSYDMFSEPQSSQMDPSIVYTSEQWKQHSLSLLLPQKKAINWQEDSKVMVQEQMAKTWKNRRAEMDRLRKQEKGCHFRKEEEKKESE